LFGGCSLLVASVDDYTFGDADGGMDASTSDGGRTDAGPTDAATPVDAGPPTCERPLDCDDGVFCNGAERCDPSDPMADALGCLPPEGDRCLPSQTCDEAMGACLTMCDVESDADGDGVDAMECGGTDCDDSDPDRFPGNPEVCDPLDRDEDCDLTTYGARDEDGDTFDDAACCNVDGVTLNCGDDCDDGNDAINPDATELCNGEDDDCNDLDDDGAEASCSLPRTMEAACTAGTCTVVTCDPGRGDCDPSDENGCETNTNNSDTHCGMCGNACGECEECSGGSCVPVTDGASCGGGGQCRDGACCTGCWDGSTCQPGNTTAACGDGGGLCESCGCASDTCASGSCEPAGGGVVDFDVSLHRCAILADGRLYCWGRNSEGQLGLGDTVMRVSPVQVLPGTSWDHIDVGDLHSCGIDASGAAFCWGDNTFGRLGVGDTMRRELPTAVRSLSLPSRISAGVRSAAVSTVLYAWGSSGGPDEPTMISGSAPAWSEVDAAVEQTVLWAIRSGDLYAVDFYSAGVALLDDTDTWVEVDAGAFNGCARNSGREIHCMGDNSSGGMGTGSAGAVNSLTRIGSRSDWADISLSQEMLCAVTTGGRLYCAWGDRPTGTPTLDASRVGSRTDWARVATHFDQACATRTDGTLWCFLGDPVSTTPTRICF